MPKLFPKMPRLPPKAKIIRYLFLGLLFALFLTMFFKVKEGFFQSVTSPTTLPGNGPTSGKAEAGKLAGPPPASMTQGKPLSIAPIANTAQQTDASGTLVATLNASQLSALDTSDLAVALTAAAPSIQMLSPSLEFTLPPSDMSGLSNISSNASCINGNLAVGCPCTTGQICNGSATCVDGRCQLPVR